MSHRQRSLPHDRQHRRRQPQEACGVGHHHTTATDLLADLLLGEGELGHQLLITQSLVDGIEVLTLEILNECELEHLQIGGDSLNHRHFGQARQSGSPPSAFTGDQLEEIAHHAHHQGLDDALLANRIG